MLTPITQDLTASKVLTTLPVRVVDQLITRALVDYPLMNVAHVETVRNGLKQIIYTDYRDGDNKSGFADVVIGDFNAGLEPVFTETFQALTEFHKGYDILDSMLNDVTVSAGLFLSIVDDYARAILQPFAKRMFQELVSALDTNETGTYDEVVEIKVTGTTPVEIAREKAKAIYAKLQGLNTPSRKHLKHLPTGASKALEFRAKTEDLIAIISTAYASSYKYDLTANTFQLGEINMKFKEVVELDFSLLQDYSLVTSASQVLKDYEVLFIQPEKLNIIKHYQGTKTVNTPKLKTVTHTYAKFDTFKRKDKIALAFKTKKP